MPLSHANLPKLFENAPGYIAVLKVPGYTFEFANRTYRQLFPGKDIIGKSLSDVAPEIVDQGFLELLEEVSRSGEPYTAESLPVCIGDETEPRFFSFVYQPIHGDAGEVIGIFAEGLDVTVARRAELAQWQAERRLQAVLDNASVAIFLMDDRQQCSYMNAAAERLTGYTLAETKGRALHHVIHHTRPDGTHYPIEECPIDRAFPENSNTQGEDVFVHKDGHFYPVAYTASPVRDEASRTVGTIIEVRDISKEKAAERRQQLLIDELNHRVKNNLSIVQALAQQTFKGSVVPAELREAFDGRLGSLARAHTLLTERTWSSAPLKRLLDDTFHSMHREHQVSLSGPDILLPAETSVTMALAIHELATNALKYGALSRPSGKVDVRWSTDKDRLLLEWRESGGPLLKGEIQPGFGTRMIKQALARAFDARVEISFAETGLVCLMDARLPE